MKVTMLLCDAAQAVGGKLYILGGGFSVIGPDPAPMAVAMKIEIPWDEANRRHPFRLFLRDADGNPVTVDAGGQTQPVEVTGHLEVGRPAGVPEGTPLDLPMVMNFGPLRLASGQRFEWRIEIDGESRVDWYVSFYTRVPTGSVT